jgi:hypothetical protein
MIQLVGQQSVSAPVPRQKVDLPSMHLTSDDRIRGIAKRGFDPLFRGLCDALHLIKAASADDANGWYVSIHFLRKGAQASRLRPSQGKLQGVLPAILFARNAGFRFNLPV